VTSWRDLGLVDLRIQAEIAHELARVLKAADVADRSRDRRCSSEVHPRHGEQQLDRVVNECRPGDDLVQAGALLAQEPQLAEARRHRLSLVRGQLDAVGQPHLREEAGAKELGQGPGIELVGLGPCRSDRLGDRGVGHDDPRHVGLDDPGDGKGVAGCLEPDLIGRPQRRSERDQRCSARRHSRMSADLSVVAMDIKTDRTHPCSSRHRLGDRRANDNYGYGLAAQPGPSQGRSTTTAGSKPIVVVSACPTCVLPGTPDPVRLKVTNRAPWRPVPLSWPYNEVRPQRAIGSAHAGVGRWRPKEGSPVGQTSPSPPTTASGSDRIDGDGKVTLRYRSRLLHLGVGRRWAGTRVLLLVADLDVRVVNEQGELLAEFRLDPTRVYQAQKRPGRGG